MANWYDDPNSNSPEQWAPESSGSAIPEALRRWLDFGNRQGPQMPEWNQNVNVRENYQNIVKSDWAQPENYMWASGVAGPTRVVSRGPGKTSYVKYWGKNEPEPSMNDTKSFIEFIEPAWQYPSNKPGLSLSDQQGWYMPAHWETIQNAHPGARGAHDLLETFLNYLSPGHVNQMTMSTIVPQAAPWWKSIIRRIERKKPELSGLKENILENLKGTELKYGKENIPKTSYGWAKKDPWENWTLDD